MGEEAVLRELIIVSANSSSFQSEIARASRMGTRLLPHYGTGREKLQRPRVKLSGLWLT